MTYKLSAAKLQSYQSCPQAYYFRYERGLTKKPMFGSAKLGQALHKTLAKVYRDWHYQDPYPTGEWIDFCWSQHQTKLGPAQIAEGREILRHYYDRFIVTQKAMHKPLGVESEIKGRFEVENLEFYLTGRYDRLDWIEDGLELIDYKSTKDVKEPEPTELNLQMGLYYLGLEQTYKYSLKRLSLLYLRTGTVQSFDVTPQHKQHVEKLIGHLALRLRTEREWEPTPGKQCDRCSYSRYCPAIQETPEPLPDEAKPERPLQLVLNL